MFKRLTVLVVSTLLIFAASNPLAAQSTPAPAGPIGTMPSPDRGQEQAGTDAALRANVQRESYVLGKGDVIEVSVIGRTDFNARVQIQDDGSVLLPLINSVSAAGRSVLQLREDVRRTLKQGGFFENPAVNVSVVSFASRYVTVLGAVNAPGVVPIDRAYRLSEIVARAGGVANPAIDSITLTRVDGGSHEYSLRAIATGGTTNDPLVSDGDKVYVPQPKIFYIYGQVNAPGAYPVTGEMTLQMALARGGGLTGLGSDKRIKLVRAGKETKAQLGDKVLPEDVVVVGERFF